MAGAAAEVFAAAHLLDVDLVAHFLGQDFSRDGGAGDGGLADFYSAGAGDEEDVVEGDGIAGVGAVAEVDLDFVAALNFVLAAVGGNDGVHRWTRRTYSKANCKNGKPCNLRFVGRSVEGQAASLAAKSGGE